MGAIPYKKTPLAPVHTAWNASKEVGKADVKGLKVMCAYFDGDGSTKGQYKLPHHQGDDNHACVWRAVVQAAARLDQTDMPDDAKAAVKKHLGAHYKEFGKPSPWDDTGKAINPIVSSNALTMLVDEMSLKGMVGTLQKSSPFKTEVAVDTDKREVTMYAAAFGNVDGVNDILIKGALRKSIQEDESAGMIRAFYNHNLDALLGHPIHQEEDSKGYLTITRFSKNSLALDRLADIDNGSLTHGSIGYKIRPNGARMIEHKGQRVRELNDIQLLEYSFVTLPANDQAEIVGVKSLYDVRSMLYQLPQAISWLVSPEQYVNFSQELVEEVIAELEAMADQLRVIGGVTPEHDGTPDPTESDTPPMDGPTVQALTDLLGSVSAVPAPGCF